MEEILMNLTDAEIALLEKEHPTFRKSNRPRKVTQWSNYEIVHSQADNG